MNEWNMFSKNYGTYYFFLEEAGELEIFVSLVERLMIVKEQFATGITKEITKENQAAWEHTVREYDELCLKFKEYDKMYQTFREDYMIRRDCGENIIEETFKRMDDIRDFARNRKTA